MTSKKEVQLKLLLNKVHLPKGAGMESSSPQEGGTTDEDYYGQPVTNAQ
jgi:hypothetical protein